MDSYLNAGFGEFLSEEDLMLIRDLGYMGIRQDIRLGYSYEFVKALVENALPVPNSKAIFIVEARGAQDLAQRVAVATRTLGAGSRCVVEVGNEPDTDEYWRYHPEEFGQLVSDTAAMVERTDPALVVISGGITSTSKDALSWLRAAAHYIPATCGIGFHTYRSGPPATPLPGFRSRGDEFDMLREVAGGRTLYNTEFGWSTKPKSKGFPLCWVKTGLSNETAAAYLFSEIGINRANGVQSICVYQLNDPPSGPEFGIRYLDGTLKPQSQVLL